MAMVRWILVLATKSLARFSECVEWQVPTKPSQSLELIESLDLSLLLGSRQQQHFTIDSFKSCCVNWIRC